MRVCACSSGGGGANAQRTHRRVVRAAHLDLLVRAAGGEVAIGVKVDREDGLLAVPHDLQRLGLHRRGARARGAEMARATARSAVDAPHARAREWRHTLAVLNSSHGRDREATDGATTARLARFAARALCSERWGAVARERLRRDRHTHHTANEVPNQLLHAPLGSRACRRPEELFFERTHGRATCPVVTVLALCSSLLLLFSVVLFGALRFGARRRAGARRRVIVVAR